jgi:NAD(P)-dependent dehydrogenase (short-subunit alcohol dehydrogenase family)
MALSRGMNVALIDYDSGDKSCESESALPLFGVDLTDRDQCTVAMKSVADRFGGIDALFNIAGGFIWETVDDRSPGTWTKMYRLNVMTAVCATGAALPYLKASLSGRVVSVGSAAALKGAAGMGPYSASKCGVHALTLNLAEELKNTNVTVNAVLPSIIDTPANRTEMPDADHVKWVSPSDLAEVMLFLSSDAARAVTGALLPVTGRM